MYWVLGVGLIIVRLLHNEVSLPLQSQAHRQTCKQEEMIKIKIPTLCLLACYDKVNWKENIYAHLLLRQG